MNLSFRWWNTDENIILHILLQAEGSLVSLKSRPSIHRKQVWLHSFSVPFVHLDCCSQPSLGLGLLQSGLWIIRRHWTRAAQYWKQALQYFGLMRYEKIQETSPHNLTVSVWKELIILVMIGLILERSTIYKTTTAGCAEWSVNVRCACRSCLFLTNSQEPNQTKLCHIKTNFSHRSGIGNEASCELFLFLTLHTLP